MKGKFNCLPSPIKGVTLLITNGMEIKEQINSPDFSMKDLLAKSEFDLPKVGQVLTGEIIGISKNSVLIDLGALGTGIIYPGNFMTIPICKKPSRRASRSRQSYWTLKTRRVIASFR